MTKNQMFAATLGAAMAFFAAGCGQDKGSFTDSRDGKEYKTVKIGEQFWMAENLNYAGSGVDTLGRCYNDSIAYCEKYGKLYDFEAAAKVCPEGWHLPSDEEWKTLTEFIGLRAGERLKAKDGGWGWRNWGLPNDTKDSSNDEFGFSALPGGYGELPYWGSDEHRFSDVGAKGVWWSATEDEDDYALGRMMRTSSITGDNGLDVDRYFYSKKGLNSVRCIKGDSAASIPAVAEKADCPAYDSKTHFCDNRDGKVYKYAKINKEIWMAENLNYKIANSECYDNNPANCEKYGRLYNHDAAYKDICPEDWHVPKGFSSSAIKTKKFSALPSGFGNADGSFSEMGNYTGWWDRGWSSYYYYLYFKIDSSGHTGISADWDRKLGTCVHTWGHGCKVYTLPIRCQKNPQCGKEYYNPYKQECCDGKAVYDNDKQSCINGKVMNNSDLCDGKEYNHDKQFCYRFTEECRCDCPTPTVERSEILDKCGGKEYDFRKQFCQNGAVKDRLCGGNEYDPFLAFCHKDGIYEKCVGMEYNPETHYCGPICFAVCGACGYWDSHGLIEYCGGKEYDIETKFCYEGELYDRCSVFTDDESDYEAHSCGDDKRCAYAEYNPKTQICRDNELADACGDKGYNKETELCYNGQVYKFVRIGSQIWTAENLNLATENSRCYNDDPSNCEKYGRLYNWTEAMSVCPDGWHLPGNKEWAELTNSVSASPSMAGQMLKSKTDWSENGNGTDKFGFSLLPGGIANASNQFGHIGERGAWWTSTEDTASSDNYYRGISYSSNVIISKGSVASNLFSVRCAKD